MQIFLSFASSEEVLAEHVYRKLLDAGYDVFFSSEDIRVGEGYDARIRSEIAEADRMIFLASPTALREGRYTLTELQIASKKWPNPRNRVLPVLIEGLSPGELPYLGAVTSALVPKGDPAAAIVAEVTQRWPSTTFGRLKKPLLVLAAIAVVVAATLLLTSHFQTEDAPPGLEPTPDYPDFKGMLDKQRKLETAFFKQFLASTIVKQNLKRAYSTNRAGADKPPASDAPLPEGWDKGVITEKLAVLARWAAPSAYKDGELREEIVRAIAVEGWVVIQKGFGSNLRGMSNLESPLEKYAAPACWPYPSGRPRDLKSWCAQMLTRRYDPKRANDKKWLAGAVGDYPDITRAELAALYWKEDEGKGVNITKVVIHQLMIEFVRKAGVADALVMLDAIDSELLLKKLKLAPLIAEAEALCVGYINDLWSDALNALDSHLAEAYATLTADKNPCTAKPG